MGAGGGAGAAAFPTASAVAFPASTPEVAALVAGSTRVLAVGAQSSLTGGATPRGHLVISTRSLTGMALEGERVRAGAGVPLAELQRALAAVHRWYPPAPTFDGAFLGGTIATNAAGAATFKYGSTRPWVEAITVVLADGSVVDIQRGEVTASAEGWFELQRMNGDVTPVLLPTYVMPAVAKLAAGYYVREGMDLIDLFIGSEGTLGIITEATVRTLVRPRTCAALVTCADDGQAVRVTAALREEAQRSWRGAGVLDVNAIEYMSDRALDMLPASAWSRSGVERPGAGVALLLVQLEISGDDHVALERLAQVLADCDVSADPAVAPPGDDRAAARFFELREAVPATVNARIADTRVRVSPVIHKIAGDFVVPFDRLEESLALYRRVGERYDLDYAVWGHVSDGNLHPNVIPRGLQDVEPGLSALLEMAVGVMAMGGAPLAEHGVGRHWMKRRLLKALYGDKGIEEMRAVKRALDPEWKLADGVLFDRTLSSTEAG